MKFKISLKKVRRMYNRQNRINNILLLLDDLRNGPALYSISSYIMSNVWSFWCSTRTELVQKWSLLVRIRTSMDRISICFFEPGYLHFRPDSGQMEEELDEVQLVWKKQDGVVQEDLQQARGQSEADLIISLFSIIILLVVVCHNLKVLSPY